MNNEIKTAIASALNASFEYGKLYCQQSESVFSAEQKRGKATRETFIGFAKETAEAIAERATPAAASAGAAGTIFTTDFETVLNTWWHANTTPTVATAHAAIIAHIDQHTAAAIASLQAALDATIKLTGEVIEDRNAEIERLRAGQAQATEGGTIHAPDYQPSSIIVDACCAATAPVSAAPTAERVFEIWSQGAYENKEQGIAWGATFIGKQEGSDFVDACKRRAEGNPEFRKFFDEKRMEYWGGRLFDNQEDAERASPKPSAGAPVSTAPDAWITPQVAQNLDRQYRDGFQAGWTASIDGNEEALGAVLNRVKPLADYQEAKSVSAADKMTDAGNPASPKTVEFDGIAEGQELPALPEPEYLGGDEAYGDRVYGHTDSAMQDYARSALAMRQPQPLPTTYRQVAGWESARMEPDPAGEWVKRADLAMGVKGGA